MLNQKYIIRREKSEAMLQYATLYFHRLEKLRPAVKEAALAKWPTQERVVDNILDIRPK